MQTRPHCICTKSLTLTEANKDIATMLEEEADFIKEQIVLCIKSEAEWNRILDSFSISKADMKAFNVEEMEAWDFENGESDQEDKSEHGEDAEPSDNELLVTLPSDMDSLTQDPYIKALFILHEDISKQLVF